MPLYFPLLNLPSGLKKPSSKVLPAETRVPPSFLSQSTGVMVSLAEQYRTEHKKKMADSMWVAETGTMNFLLIILPSIVVSQRTMKGLLLLYCTLIFNGDFSSWLLSGEKSYQYSYLDFPFWCIAFISGLLWQLESLRWQL